MEKDSLEEKLLRLGAKVLKMHLQNPNDQDLGREVRAVIKKDLQTTIKNHYLKKKDD